MAHNRQNRYIQTIHTTQVDTVSQMQLNNSHESGSYITFRSGSTFYALPIGHVRYISARDALTIRSTPQQNQTASHVFEYDGKATALYRFCSLAGSSSQVDESTELVELLSARRQDHVDWVDALEYSIQTGEPFTKATDPHMCAFGKWYDQYHPEDEELKEIMAAFDAPHKRIHSLGLQLTDLAHAQNDKAQAMRILRKERSTTLKELMNHFAKAILRLEDMVRPVVLVLDSGEKNFALEVETVSDIKHFENNAWLEEQCKTTDDTYYDGYFQSSDGELFLNVVPKALLSYAEQQAQLA